MCSSVTVTSMDNGWKQTLLPRLQRAGINYCRDAQHFQGGGSSVLNMERGIKESARTVAVLTPEWVDSEWSQLEALMTIAHDPIGRRRRLVPLLLKKCKPSPAIRILTYRDLTDETRAEAEWQKLTLDLRGKPGRCCGNRPRSLPRSRPPSSSREALRRWLKPFRTTRDVHDEVVKYRAYFELVHRMVERLTFWKRLHDQLHNVERDCFRPLLKFSSRFPDEQTMIQLEECKTNLSYALVHLQEVFNQDSVDKGPVPWHQALLTPAAKDLDAALRLAQDQQAAGAAMSLRLAMHKLQRVLTMEPPTIDARLQSQAEAVPVKELLRALATLCDNLRGANIQSTKLLQFQQGAEGLFNLCQRLHWLRRDHHCWQEIDRELRFLESEDTDLPEEVIGAWEYLRALLALVETDTANPFIREVAQDVVQLGAAIERKNARAIKLRFFSLRSHAINQFYVADNRLLALCEQLTRIGAPLEMLLGVLSDD